MVEFCDDGDEPSYSMTIGNFLRNWIHIDGFCVNELGLFMSCTVYQVMIIVKFPSPNVGEVIKW